MSELKTYTPSELFEAVTGNPLVFARVLRIPYLVASLLQWRSTSRTLLIQLLGLLESSQGWVDVPHAVLAETLWPELHKETAKNKLTRWLSVFDEDQYLSRFMAIRRKPGHYKKTGVAKDDVEFLPSRYRVEMFWPFASELGCRVLNEKVLEYPTLRERQTHQRSIVVALLIDLGAVAILPEMRTEHAVRKSESKEKGKLEKRIIEAKEGRVMLSRDEIFQIQSLSERLDVLLSQSLTFGKMFFDLVEQMTDYNEAWQMVEDGKKLFGEMAENCIRRRRAGEQMSRDARAERSRLVA